MHVITLTRVENPLKELKENSIGKKRILWCVNVLNFIDIIGQIEKRK